MKGPLKKKNVFTTEEYIPASILIQSNKSKQKFMYEKLASTKPVKKKKTLGLILYKKYCTNKK